MSPALLWFLLAGALIVGEILTPTFFLAALAFAAGAAAVAGLVGAELLIQVLVFAIAAGISTALARPLAERFLHSGVRSLPTNVAALIGAEARVTETIEVDRMGRVKVRGDDWRAVSDDGQAIAAGARVIVIEVEGTTLHVVPHP